jgi:hypothetical protein
VAPQLVVQRIFDSPDVYGELRGWLASEFRKDGERDPIAQEIFDELGLEGDSPRSLLESERFRELLAEPAMARAA